MCDFKRIYKHKIYIYYIYMNFNSDFKIRPTILQHPLYFDSTKEEALKFKSHSLADASTKMAFENPIVGSYEKVS